MAGMPKIAQIEFSWGPGQNPNEGGGQRSAAGGGKDEGQNTNAPVNRKMLGNQKGFLKSIFGVNTGVAALLKQSQIFTGIVGTIFQILGALVDVILAPFLPIVIPAIKLIARQIPIVAEWSRRLYKFVEPLFDFFGDMFGGLAGKFASSLESILGLVILTGFMAKLTGLWGPWMATVKASLNIVKAILRLVNNALFKILPEITALVGRLATALGTVLYDKIGKYIVMGTVAVKNLLTPIGVTLANLGGSLLEGFKGAIDKLWLNFKNLFPDNWIDDIGKAVAAATSSVAKKAGGMFSGLAGKLGGTGAAKMFGGLVDKLSIDKVGKVGNVGLGDFAKFVTKNPSQIAKLSKTIPVLSTLVTAGMATYRTGKAASQGEWGKAAAYAGAGAGFTIGQFLADISSVTGVGLAASGALAVGEVVALNQIDKAFEPKVTNQDAVQNRMSAPTNLADDDPSNRNGG